MQAIKVQIILPNNDNTSSRASSKITYCQKGNQINKIDQLNLSPGEERVSFPRFLNYHNKC